MWRRILVLSLWLSLLTGCAPVISWRTDLAHHYQARKAWDEYKTRGARREFGSDFVRGWKSGYFDAACGGNGSPPAVPPERYWKPYFQTPEGHQQVDAWYEGYQSGTIAGDQDGVQLLAQIPTAPGLGARPQKFWGPLPPTDMPVEEAIPAPDSSVAPEEEVARLPDGATPPVPGSQSQPRLASQPKPAATSTPFATPQPVSPVASQPTVAVVPPVNAPPDAPPPSAVVETAPAAVEAAPSTPEPEQVAAARPKADVTPPKKKLAFKWPLWIKPAPAVAAAPPERVLTAEPEPATSPVAETVPSTPEPEHVAVAEPVADDKQPTETPVASSPVVTAPVSTEPATPVVVASSEKTPATEAAAPSVAKAAPSAAEPEHVAPPAPKTEVVRSAKKSTMRSPVVTEAVEPIATTPLATAPSTEPEPTVSVEAAPRAPEPAKVAASQPKADVVPLNKKPGAERHVVTETFEVDHAPAATPPARPAAAAKKAARQPQPPRVKLVVPQEDGRPQSSLVIVAAAAEVDVPSSESEHTPATVVKPQQVRLMSRVVEPAVGFAESWRPVTPIAAATPEPEPESGAERPLVVVSVKPSKATDEDFAPADVTVRKIRWPKAAQGDEPSTDSEPVSVAESGATAEDEKSLAAAPAVSSSAISESSLRFLHAWTFSKPAVEKKPDAKSGEATGLAVEATEQRPTAPLSPQLRGTESMAARTTVRFR